MPKRCGQRCFQLCFLLVPLVFTTFIYITISDRSKRHVNISLEVTSDMFYVESIDVTNGSVNLFGHFYDFSKMSNATKKSVINLFGLENREYFGKSPKFKFSRDNVLYLNCADLFESKDETALNETKEIISNITTDSYSPADYINMTKNCSHFKSQRTYIMNTLTKEESDFPIAYSILVYRDIEQFERLLRAIYRPQNYMCVHVDIKADEEVFKAVESIVCCFPNVFMSPKRVSVTWGEFSVLEPDLICMKFLYEQNRLWKYFINLTGQEFPLKTNYEIVKILSAYNGANDIEGTIKRGRPERWKDRGPPPHNVTVTKGSVHIIASHGYVEYMLTNQKALDILEWAKNTYIPDETFFTILNHNPHLKVPGSYVGEPETGPLKPYLARFKNWGDYACAGYYLRGICIFGIGDLPALAKREELFANKFIWDSPSRVAYECLEELLYNRTKENYLSERTNINITWYATRGFVKNQIHL